MKEITINGIIYIPKEEKQKLQIENLKFVIIRSQSAGVHMGYLGQKDKDEVTLYHTRRIWYWSGAASLSQLALEGVKKSNDCKFSVELESNTILGTIEIIPITEFAEKILKGVPVWKI